MRKINIDFQNGNSVMYAIGSDIDIAKLQKEIFTEKFITVTDVALGRTDVIATSSIVTGAAYRCRGACGGIGGIVWSQ